MLCRRQDGLLLFCGLAIPVGIGQGRAGLLPSLSPVAPKEVPIEAVEGQLSGRCGLHLIVTPLAVVAHPLEIGAAAGVTCCPSGRHRQNWLMPRVLGAPPTQWHPHRCRDTRHPPRQGGSPPAEAKLPVTISRWIWWATVLEGLSNGVTYAGHAGFSIPEKTGQGRSAPRKLVRR